MKTVHRLYLILALILLGIVGISTARAQTFYVQPNTTPLKPVDVAQLPFSVTFDFITPPGWLATQGMAWVPVWPRNAAGAWYRPISYTQPQLYISKLWPYAYKCNVEGMGFRCLDIARSIWRNVACPSSLVMGGLRFWRSVYESAWPEYGLFTANVGPFASSTPTLKTVYLQRVSVTNSGTFLNCSYGQPTGSGPGTSLDVWVYRR